MLGVYVVFIVKIRCFFVCRHNHVFLERIDNGEQNGGKLVSIAAANMEVESSNFKISSHS